MRRIIERVVTVVTTTTWTISWQNEPSTPDPQAQPVVEIAPHPAVSEEGAKTIQKYSSVTQTKEAYAEEMKLETDSPVDNSPQAPNS